MILNVIDRKIRNSFSEAALQYEMLTSLHKEIGRELTKKFMGHDPCAAILDVGMGTGWFTRRLTNIFPDALVIGLDFAPGMIARAQKQDATFRIVQANAVYLPFKENTFDIITSNLAYQWVGDLSRAFAFCHSRLKRNGGLYLTMFGRDTFRELFAALEACSENGSFPVQRLAGKDQIVKNLKDAGFTHTQVTGELIKVRFPDMMGLIKWIKDIGANALPKDAYMGKDLLLKANDYYNTHFKDHLGIYATFEVIWIEAQR
jgi:malonyl-CoA O-methyltransferase